MSLVSWIQTHSGRPVDPLAPDADSLIIEDIAHALSHVNRFTGHTRRPHSVALHSLTVSRLVQLRGGTPEARLWALLHDATEAYLSDIASPVKQSPIFAAYRQAEDRLATVIAEKFLGRAPTPAEAAAVKAADRDMLHAERKNLLPPGAWRLTETVPADACQAFVWGCQFRAPDVQRAIFLLMFDSLGGGR